LRGKHARAFQESGVLLPDEAREVTFPHGVPVRMIESEEAAESAEPVLKKPAAEPEKEQARKSWTLGENLLTSSSSVDTS